MTTKERRVGPAGLLKSGSSWLDDKASFATDDPGLEQAAVMLWNISAAIRARQGQLRLSITALADKSGIRRQTVTDVTMGTTWPDAATLARICSVLNLDLTAIEHKVSPR
jgi:DNA-binding phage protein